MACVAQAYEVRCVCCVSRVTSSVPVPNGTESIMGGEQHVIAVHEWDTTSAQSPQIIDFEAVGGEGDIDFEDDLDAESTEFPQGTNHVIAISEGDDNDRVRASNVLQVQPNFAMAKDRFLGREGPLHQNLSRATKWTCWKKVLLTTGPVDEQQLGLTETTTFLAQR